METEIPTLEIAAARPMPDPGEAPDPAISLRLMPGDFALIQALDPARARGFADLCCGLVPLAEGSVRVIGRHWHGLPREHAQALRGRIGRIFGSGGWLGFLDIETNILLGQLHHTRIPQAALRDAAAELARDFGLPGLPLGRASSLSPADIARAACVRAFLCDPVLVLLESPVQAQYADIVTPLLGAIATARDSGAAVVWLTRSEMIWHDRSIPANHRLRLEERGLLSARMSTRSEAA